MNILIRSRKSSIKKLIMDRLVFVGGGNMAEAMLKGCLSADVCKARQVVVTDIKAERLKTIEAKYKVKTSLKNVNPVSAADIVLLAVKPQNIEEVLQELSSVIDKNKLIVSIAAGISIKQLQKKVDWKIVRVMPNTPALIGAGITAMCYNANVKNEDKKVVQNIFAAVGSVVEVEESDINAITALSGSGPAFIYRIADILIKAGVKIGLSPNIAKKLTLQTLVGAAKMIEQTGEDPETLIRKVASPGGTTEAGLKVLDSSKIKEELTSTIIAAKKRADELTGGK